MVYRNLLSRYLLTVSASLGTLRVPGEVRLHGVEEVKGVHVVCRDLVAGDAHHQHEVHESVRRVARQPQAVEADLGERGVHVAGSDPADRLAVELWIRSVRAELPRAAELQLQVAGA